MPRQTQRQLQATQRRAATLAVRESPQNRSKPNLLRAGVAFGRRLAVASPLHRTHTLINLWSIAGEERR